VRREFLSGLKVIIAMSNAGDMDLEARVLSGLAAESSSSRYGLPFLGDNAFLPDRIEAVASPSLITWRDGGESPARISCSGVSWYEKLDAETTKAEPRAARLTLQIDRADMSKTRSDLFAPGDPIDPESSPPQNAWVTIESITAPKPEKKPRK
jgi:CRISPR-associated protein Cas5t